MVFKTCEELHCEEEKRQANKRAFNNKEIITARNHWVAREQRCIIEMKETPGWKLIRDENTDA